MAGSKATTVEAYLKELAEERRVEIAAVRKLVLRHLPEGYEEGMSYGMISWHVPLAKYPDTYNKQPLGYLGLAAQKNYNALYLMGCHVDSSQEKRLKDAYRKAGRKIDMGKVCLRFQRAGELPVEVLGKLIAEMKPADMIAVHEKSHPSRRK